VEALLAAVDVDYRHDVVVAACVCFAEYADDRPMKELTLRSSTVPAAYESGQFYRRELPYVLDVLGRLDRLPRVVIVDGHVWLGPDVPGMGARLHGELNQRTVVIGVAKRAYRGATSSVVVRRGRSTHPLYVSAAGIDVGRAAEHVRDMHGPYRIPTLLKRVDRLSRDG
jgi:deoxyribonuclease V